jgi:hypothetical protein
MNMELRAAKLLGISSSPRLRRGLLFVAIHPRSKLRGILDKQ